MLTRVFSKWFVTSLYICRYLIRNFCRSRNQTWAKTKHLNLFQRHTIVIAILNFSRNDDANVCVDTWLHAWLILPHKIVSLKGRNVRERDNSPFRFVGNIFFFALWPSPTKNGESAASVAPRLQVAWRTCCQVTGNMKLRWKGVWMGPYFVSLWKTSCKFRISGCQLARRCSLIVYLQTCLGFPGIKLNWFEHVKTNNWQTKECI